MTKYEKISDNCKIAWIPQFKITNEKYTQVSGYIFNEKNELLIVRNDNWTIPGGHPEQYEYTIGTLEREIKEEACITIKDISYMGAVEVIENKEKYYQLRYFARVDKKHRFDNNWETKERKFVKLEDLSKYIKWANGKVFKEQINYAKKYLTEQNKLKILVYQPRASYYTGGGEVYPLQNAKFFAELGHNVTLLTTKASFIQESDYFIDFKRNNPKVNIEYLELDDSFKNIYDTKPGINWERWDEESLWVSRLAYQYLSTHNYDFVAIHNVIDDLAVPPNVPHALHLHGSPSELNYICKLILKQENNLIAVSENVRQKWQELGINKDMKICTNAIDENMFYYDKTKTRKNDILFVGRLIPIKGIEFIIESIKILKEKYNMNINLSIIGKGPYEEELKQLTKKFKLEKSISFLGLVSQEKLIDMYQTSKIAVFPSIGKEGIMSTLLEAASCKTPTITTEGTSMAEFAQNNKNALLVHMKDATDIADKIYELLTNKELYNKIAENAYKEVISKYTWKAKCEEIIRTYGDFLK